VDEGELSPFAGAVGHFDDLGAQAEL